MNRLQRVAASLLISLAFGVQAVLAQTPVAPSEADNNSAMNAEMFYQLLLGELNALGGEPGVGYQLLLDAARKTGDARLYRRATDIALQARSSDSALQASRAWRQAIPDSREANRYLLQILIGLNRGAEVAESLQRELKISRGDDLLQTIGNLPRLFARLGDKKQALTLVEEGLAEFLTSPTVGATAWTTIGRMRVDAGDPAAALEAAQRGSALDASADGPAILALSMMDPKVPLAEVIVKRYLKGKARTEVRMDYARALLSAQRFSESAAQIKMVTSAQPNYAPAWLVRGMLEQQDKQAAAAEQSLTRYVELATRQPSTGEGEERARSLTQAYLTLSELALQRKDDGAAQAWLARIDSPQDMANIQSRRAAILARQGKLAEARALIQTLPQSSPAEARMRLGAEVQLLRENKQYRAAFDLLKTALVTYADDADLMYEQAMVAEKMDDLVEMERLLRKVIAVRPESPNAYNALGYSFADRSVRLSEARQLIVKALEYAPGDPFISDSLAWVEFRAGNLPEALRILQKAFGDKPDAEIAAHLGEVLWMMGDKDKALAVWKQGVEINPDNETLLETLKRLRVNL
ncbi:MAG: tetratricopeptide repeat protein [Burkholderiaceae bacterium]